MLKKPPNAENAQSNPMITPDRFFQEVILFMQNLGGKQFF
jgi:hypothetical protein